MECGVIGLVALSRLTCDVGRAEIPPTLVASVAAKLKDLGPSPPPSSYFLQKLMIDSDDVEEEVRKRLLAALPNFSPNSHKNLRRRSSS